MPDLDHDPEDASEGAALGAIEPSGVDFNHAWRAEGLEPAVEKSDQGEGGERADEGGESENQIARDCADGTDELTITGSSAVAALENGHVIDLEIHPEDAGLPVHPFEAILGGSPEDNGKAFAALLDGAPSAYRDAVLLNAAAALKIAGKASSLREGVEWAAAAIDSGAAKSKVTALAALTSAA